MMPGDMVYLVYGWDSMASSMGDEYLEGIYTSKDKARARVEDMNNRARAHWMRTASPAGRANYQDRARVEVQLLK